MKKGKYKCKKNTIILYEGADNNPIFKNKSDVSSSIMVRIRGSIYVNVPFKTYEKLNSIDKLYFRSRLFQYDEGEYDWTEIAEWNNILTSPEAILNLLYEIKVNFLAFCIELPKIWNIPSEIRYKKIKFKDKSGHKHKMSFNKFVRKYLKGVVI